MHNNENSVEATRELVDFLSDSRVWRKFLNESGFVPGDIVIADPFKAGTTWTQRTIEQILNNGEESAEDLSDKSPWLDSSWGNHDQMIQKLIVQKNQNIRRVIKSHLPADAVPINPDVRYIFVGRNGKDLVCSFHNYLRNFNNETVDLINELYKTWSQKNDEMVIPEKNGEFFDLWLSTDGYNCCDVFNVTLSWWKLRNLPNVLMLHYNQLLNDTENQIIQLAEFINVDVNTLNIEKIKEHCNFNYMKQRADKLVPFGGKHMKDSKAFFHRGPERDYRSELSEEQIRKFDIAANDRLGSQCAHWLETGEFT